MVRRLALALMLATAAAPVIAGPTVRDLVETADLSGLAVSPDGALVAFRTERASIADNRHILTWHVARPDGSGVREIAGGGGALWSDMGALLPEPPIWSPDSRYLYFRALIDGAIQVWRAAADGSGARAVTADAADILSFALSRDGTVLRYRVSATREAIRRAEEAEYDAGILVDATVDPRQNLFRGAIVNGRLASQRLTGNWFARAGLLWDAPRRERSIDLATGDVIDLPSVESAPAAAADQGWPPRLEAHAANGDLAAAERTEAGTVLRVRMAGATEDRNCVAAPCQGRIVWLAWRPGREQLLFATSGDDFAQTLYLWDVRGAAVREIARDSGLLNGGRDLNPPCVVTRDAALCVAASALSPPRLERIDLDNGRRTILFDPNAPRRAASGVTVEALRWTDTTGTTFTGRLFRPDTPTPGRLPLFVNYYGCDGFLRGGVGDEWPLAPMAAVGIAALCINRPREAGDLYDPLSRYGTALSGVRAAIDLLDRRGLIDRRRVGMGGLSFGSEVTMWTAIHSDLLAAASIASGQLEPAYYWFNGVRGRTNHANLERAWGLRAPDETPERWRQLSPALNAARIRAPLLLQLPEQEAATAIELYARLSNLPTPTELYVFPHEPHIKVQPRHQLAVNQRNLDWFRFWLQGHVDPDPAKAAQYRRWRELQTRARGSRDTAPAAQP